MKTNGPRAADIQNIFTSVAHGYDRANDWMTLGMARGWRRRVVRDSGVGTGQSVLDCATGTGDLALEFKRAVGPTGRVVGTDFCAGMLERAPGKARRSGLDVEFALADVLALDYADGTFDVSSIAYGIRNVEDPVRALAELARVVKPGGTVMVLETGDAPDGPLKPFMGFYIRQIVPRIGGFLTGQRGAYEYLNRSSRAFPSRGKFLDLMRATGRFESCTCEVLLGGASFIYRGVVA